jgi:hypothetical protein
MSKPPTQPFGQRLTRAILRAKERPFGHGKPKKAPPVRLFKTKRKVTLPKLKFLD